MIDENATHRLGGGREEMPGVIPLDLVTNEAKIRFVDQRRRLKCYPRCFSRHSRGRELAKFFIDQGEEFVSARAIGL